MKVWLINPWDALPGELGFERGQQISAGLVHKGHSVVWWVGSFSHAEKKQRTRPAEPSGVAVRVLQTLGYARNTGAARMLSIAVFSLRLTFFRGSAERPDAVVVSGPVFFCEPFLLYLSIVRRIPVVYEFRDLWPESIIDSAKGGRRWLFKLGLAPFAWLRRLVMAQCAGIVGLNQTYLDIAVREAGRHSHARTAVAYPSPSWIPPLDRAVASSAQRDGEIWVVSGGTLGASYDHETLLAAAAELKDTHPEFRFHITGTGPNFPMIKKIVQERGLANVFCLGAIPREEFCRTLSECDIGLALYRRFSSVVFPTKMVDYLLAGLPVVTSVRGEGAALVENSGAGIQIASEDPRALSEGLVALGRDPIRRSAMKKAACELGREFSVESQIGKLIDVVERCVTT